MATKKRAPGAQPGNSNALTHGFYSRRFKDIDKKDLDALNATIESEIAGMRVSARRIFDYADDMQRDGSDPMDVIKAFAVYAKQVTTIAGLLKTQAIANANGVDQNALAVIEGLKMLAQDWD